MAIVFPDQGRIAALNILLRNATAPKIRLFKNDVGPVQGSTLADFTEADFSGYAAQAAAFGAPSINGSGQGETSQNNITFTHDSGVDTGNTIYGWYITVQDPSSVDRLLFAEHFADSVLVSADGDRVRFDLRLFDQIA